LDSITLEVKTTALAYLRQPARWARRDWPRRWATHWNGISRRREKARHALQFAKCTVVFILLCVGESEGRANGAEDRKRFTAATELNG
jgi:hypothetical protein